jgi:hypothetical protein
MKFSEQAASFCRFLESVPDIHLEPKSGQSSALVFVSPWMGTAVPWYSIVFGLLYQRRRAVVTLLFDDLPHPNPVEAPEQIGHIEGVLKSLGKRFDIIRVSELPEALQADVDSSVVDEVARLNEAYLHRTGAKGDYADNLFRTALRRRVGRFRSVMNARSWGHVLLPNGIYGSSGLLRMLARQSGIRTATYDSGPGVMVLGTDSVAAHCLDLAKLFDAEFSDYISENRRRAIDLGRREFELRRDGRDRFFYQKTTYKNDSVSESDILMPMNIFDDAAALGRNRFFRGPQEWILETVDFILNSTKATVRVREHPAARRLAREDVFGPLLLERFGRSSRFEFFACDQPVSTYSLLEKARIVLPHTSTVGIEAVFLGKRVIVESDAYYSGLGIVEKADSKTDYFDRIKSAVGSTKVTSEDECERAWLCYFFGQVANFISSEFTPQPVDFERWVELEFEHIAQNPQVDQMVSVLLGGIPAWRIQSERVFNGERVKPLKPQRLWERVWPFS